MVTMWGPYDMPIKGQPTTMLRSYVAAAAGKAWLEYWHRMLQQQQQQLGGTDGTDDDLSTITTSSVPTAAHRIGE